MGEGEKERKAEAKELGELGRESADDAGCDCRYLLHCAPAPAQKLQQRQDRGVVLPWFCGTKVRRMEVPPIVRTLCVRVRSTHPSNPSPGGHSQQLTEQQPSLEEAVLPNAI